ncbi:MULTISPECIES: DEAD/DEAH box helicase [Paraburkholderia]|uniref:Superfamily II DNA/RNA helicase n=1 Tax=Paraburkholderia tropica TaxID=92647 RepID=A0ABX5MMB8_9BURK|nr:DEAD/DEAH box helicase [Paraburkholderia tropica]MBB2999559.1 superfamily II DNA/RNA helicase [Paraburkholderia tropica]MBB6318014.1 superfamily II DNA/RNA helicase [Paraburkholderia tropica]MDE1141351.1 DEAD/DEAH box helicase [Paraburkholderia tropica]PXX12469.1 superfamily II DNA/RNA helicase [Paraburkholderia tropica]PZW76446.1 superfamily II DNA/RNA helicase [Paraburkholderia tropica]
MTSSNTQSPLDAIANDALGLEQPVAAAAEGVAPAADTPAGPTFESLGLSPEIVSALTAAGYKAPTPVQERAIPAAIAGRDLLVSSPTGSGKTAAFMLPAIERFAQIQKAQAAQPREPRPQGANGQQADRRPQRRPQPVARPGLLVLTPTRELAMQVTTAASTYGKHLRRLRTVSILGGVAYGQQLMLLAKNPEILVATPGRLLDHLERGRIDLSELKMLVLDEADRMLDMGFIDDIDTIVAATPETRQTMLFSATLDGKIASITGRLLKDPERIEIVRKIEASSNIAQTVHYVDDRDHKDRLLDHLLRDEKLDQAVVFTATKMDADQLAGKLADAGFETAALHGDLPQGARNRTIRALRERRVRVLVATDVAARGIDIPGITHVFNYDLPKFAEDYVHRIGRTGRAGRSGTAVSLVHHAEQGALKRIERFVRGTLPVNVVEGFEPRKAPPANRGGFGGRGRPGGGNGGGRRFGGKPGGGYGNNRGGYGGNAGGNGGGNGERSFGDRPQGDRNGNSWGNKSDSRGGYGQREGGYGASRREGGDRGGYSQPRGDGYGRSREGFGGGRRDGGPRGARRDS